MSDLTEHQELFGHRTVTADAVARFAELTGDYARIHVDQSLGEALPGGRGFAHGLLSASWALGALGLERPSAVGFGDPERVVTEYATRFHAPVTFGDSLAMSASSQPEDPARTDFTWFGLDAGVRTTGHVILGAIPDLDAEPWPEQAPEPPTHVGNLGAEAVMEHGPRGCRPIATVTESDVVAWCRHTAALDPLALDARFAAATAAGERTIPPMLSFCLGFSVWLRELLRWPMSGGGDTAGHLGDRWRLIAPARIGDTLDVRFHPERLRRTRSRPNQGVATFALQIVGARQRVILEGEVDLMLPMDAPG